MKGGDLKKLHEAILASLNEDDLRILLKTELDLDLDQVTAAGPFSSRAFELLGYVDRRGLMPDLVTALARERPKRPDIQEIYRSYAAELAQGASQAPGDEQAFAAYDKLFEGRPQVDLQKAGSREGVVPAHAPGLERTLRADLGFLDAAFWSRSLLTTQGRMCRVEVNDPARNEMGTGFLVGPDLVLTCYHVLEKAITGAHDGSAVRFRFDYASTAGGEASEGIQVGLFKPADAARPWLVKSAPYSAGEAKGTPDSPPPKPGEYDYALVRLDRAIGGEKLAASGATRGWVEMPSEQPRLEGLPYLMILQHPEGGPLKLALDTEPKIKVEFGGLRVRYAINTERGSSGSPVFDKDWKLVALHHYGDPAWWGGPKYNQGIPIGLIHKDLGTLLQGGAHSVGGPVASKLHAASDAIEAVSKTLASNPNASRLDLEAAVTQAVEGSVESARVFARLSKGVRDVVDKKLDEADRQLAKDLGEATRGGEYSRAVDRFKRSMCDILRAARDIDGELPDDLYELWSKHRCS